MSTTPTPPPPTLRVAVELGYVRGCAACCTIAESTAVAAMRDPQVTGFRAVPGRKHACGASDGPSPQPTLPGAPTALPEGQTALFESLPHSDTNGFDPDFV